MWRFVALILMLAGLTVTTQAQTGYITVFSASLDRVDRAALENRSAQVPVRWEVRQRPILTNLVFEQIMPDGSVVNVELPRANAWVNSSGEGIAAPVLPSGSVNEIVLQLRLVQIASRQTLERATVTLRISADGAGSAPTINRVGIREFSAVNGATLQQAELQAQTARLPVRWSVTNRPQTAHLVFEQIMPDGSAVNVELPRASVWVNASGEGIVAPRLTAVDAAQVTLRLRVYDALTGSLYDVRTLTVPVVASSTTARIAEFRAFQSSVSLARMERGEERVRLSWSVVNRPPNSNLVFEQLLPDGQVVNIELPRDFVIVPDQGVGDVAPRAQNYRQGQLQVRVRLVTNTGVTLTEASQTLAIVDDRQVNGIGTEIGAGDCYSGAFPPSNGLAAGQAGRVELHFNGAPLSVYGALQDTTYTAGQLSSGATFDVIEGPRCVVMPNSNYTQRWWRIAAPNDLRGWIVEYSGETQSGVTIQAAGSSTPAILPIAIDQLTVTPPAVAPDGVITVTWATRHANRVLLIIGGVQVADLPISGSYTMDASQLRRVNPINIVLEASHRTQYNYATDQRQINFNSNTIAAITTFSAAPQTAPMGGQVTLNWAITGVDRGQILWNPDPNQLPVPLADVSTPTGSYTASIPDEYRDVTYTLQIVDASGLLVQQNVTVDVTCPYTFFAADPLRSADDCPEANAVSITAAYQAFQNGVMVWLGLPTPQIVVLYSDARVASYADTWDGSAYPLDPAPAGFFTPERGFGYLWSTNPEVRRGLGWAVSAEAGYTATYQQVELLLTRYRVPAGPVYITLPEGHVIRYNASIYGSNGWVVLY